MTTDDRLTRAIERLEQALSQLDEAPAKIWITGGYGGLLTEVLSGLRALAAELGEGLRLGSRVRVQNIEASPLYRRGQSGTVVSVRDDGYAVELDDEPGARYLFTAGQLDPLPAPPAQEADRET